MRWLASSSATRPPVPLQFLRSHQRPRSRACQKSRRGSPLERASQAGPVGRLKFTTSNHAVPSPIVDLPGCPRAGGRRRRPALRSGTSESRPAARCPQRSATFVAPGRARRRDPAAAGLASATAMILRPTHRSRSPHRCPESRQRIQNAWVQPRGPGAHSRTLILDADDVAWRSCWHSCCTILLIDHQCAGSLRASTQLFTAPRFRADPGCATAAPAARHSQARCKHDQLGSPASLQGVCSRQSQPPPMPAPARLDQTTAARPFPPQTASSARLARERGADLPARGAATARSQPISGRHALRHRLSLVLRGSCPRRHKEQQKYTDNTTAKSITFGCVPDASSVFTTSDGAYRRHGTRSGGSASGLTPRRRADALAHR